VKLLVDMNLSPLWVSFFAAAGIDAIHWSGVGRADAADSEILDFAAANGLIVFTHDLDFGALLATLHTDKPSVIQARAQDVLPAAIGDLVLRAIRTAAPHLRVGALVTVDPLRHRVRLLPI
jgi:predicted nuclease of predicted toxin-antitoxin system